MIRTYRFRLLLIGVCLLILLYNSLLIYIKLNLFKTQGRMIKQIVIMCATNYIALDSMNLTDTTQMDSLERLLLSLLRESPNEIMNLNIITYEKEVRVHLQVLKSIVMENRTITYEFISLDEIKLRFEKYIEMSQNYTAKDRYHKYHDVTVHFRPLYHKIFTYEKIVVLDVDLEFRSPLDELFNHFKQMSPNQIIAVAYDQTPYYRKAFRKYRTKNPLTSIGSPSPGHQGFNTGVMLFDLKKMRDSKELSFHLTENGYISLFGKYQMVSHLGDQDFFTLLGAEYPYLFYILDCSFNRQMSPQFFSDPLFDKYHKCDNEVKIYHGNGKSVIPKKDQNP
ncbi:xyloside xylosyltransferase 1-like [Artemia franciscana]|uniref:xyloside xylosyltransferase 1-like n=1 Tax=Artemia franciscana TaxID=6661 RepID=UPI0032DB5CE6